MTCIPLNSFITFSFNDQSEIGFVGGLVGVCKGQGDLNCLSNFESFNYQIPFLIYQIFISLFEKSIPVF